MADIFVSYTISDREWAHWIGFELERLRHVPHVHEWEIPAGGNIMAWMEQRLQKADHVLCVVSAAYLAAPYSSWERQAAQFAAADTRPNFVLPVFIEDCAAPIGMAHIKRFELYRCDEGNAGARFADYLAPPVRPSKQPRLPSARLSLSNLSIAVSIGAPNYSISLVPFDRHTPSTTWPSSNDIIGRQTS